MCDVRVAAHDQNCPKHGLLKARLNVLHCEAAREHFSAGFNKTVHLSFISLHFKPLFLVSINVLLKLLKESVLQVVRKIYVFSGGFVLPALKKSWNRI